MNENQYGPNSVLMRDLLFHTLQNNVKPNSVPAKTKETILAYSFGNTPPQLSKSRKIEPKIYKQNLSQIIININKDIEWNQNQNENINILKYQKPNLEIIQSLESDIPFSDLNTIPNINNIKSLLRKEYLQYLPIGDRLNINYLLKSFFISFYSLISEPRYLITPNKIKISFFYYSLFRQSRPYKPQTPQNLKKRLRLKYHRYSYLAKKKLSLRSQGINQLFYFTRKRMAWQKIIFEKSIRIRKIKLLKRWRWLHKKALQKKK